jgi:hypothetical protein
MPSSSEHHCVPASSDGSPKGTGSNYSMNKVAEHPACYLMHAIILCVYRLQSGFYQSSWPEPSPYTCLILLTHISFLFLFWKESESEVLTKGDCQVQH